MSPRWVAVWVVAGAAVVGALLLTAVGQPVALMSPRSGVTASAPPPSRSPTTIVPPSRAVQTGVGESLGPLSPVVGLVLQVIAVLTILLVLGVILTLIRSVWRRPGLVSRPAADFVAPGLPEELLASGPERLGLLAQGEPRNAIVAAWLSLETSAAATGLPRHPSETSTEYTMRVLRTWDVDPRSLGDLAALYREARFSRHSLGEEHRRRAMRDLTTLHEDFRRIASGAEGASTA